MALINDQTTAPGGAMQALAPDAQPQPTQPPAGGAPEGAQDPAVQRIVLAATKIIHDPKVSDQIVALMRAAGDPPTALAQGATVIMRQMAQKSQGSMPPEAAAQALPQIIGLLAELAQAAGLFEPTPEDAQAAGQQILQAMQGGGAPAQGAATTQPAAGAPPAGAPQQPMGA